MKCMKLKEAGIDLCVTIKVNPVVFMQKTSGALKEELEQLEIARVLNHIGARQKEAVAREIVQEFGHRKELS
jgi:hypothetical protein